MAEFAEKCSLTLVTKCLFVLPIKRVGSYHKNLQKDKRHLIVGPVKFHPSEKSSFEL